MANVQTYLKDLVARAEKAGRDAAETARIDPMVVEDGQKNYFVADGVCGFAWINIKPGNCGLAKYLKNEKKARPDSYYGGVTVWVSDYGQSMQKKEAYAYAYAQVLRTDGYNAYAASRMD